MWRLIGGYCPTFHLVISLTVLSSRAYAFNKCSYVRRSPASTFQSYHFRPTKCTYLSTRISTWGMYSQVWNNSSVSPYSTYSAHLFFFSWNRGVCSFRFYPWYSTSFSSRIAVIASFYFSRSRSYWDGRRYLSLLTKEFLIAILSLTGKSQNRCWYDDRFWRLLCRKSAIHQSIPDQFRIPFIVAIASCIGMGGYL